MLSEIQAEFGGDDFEVVTIATGRNPVPGVKRFFDEIGVDNLPLYLDPSSALARDMAVLGLPITVILDPDGNDPLITGEEALAERVYQGVSVRNAWTRNGQPLGTVLRGTTGDCGRSSARSGSQWMPVLRRYDSRASRNQSDGDDLRSRLS